MNDVKYFQNLVDGKTHNINTAYIGKVISINGSTARVQPLSMSFVAGVAQKQSVASAVIPPNIKYKKETITYMETHYTSRTKTFLVPDNLAVGDIVYVGVCDKDITHAVNGVISEATPRHHNINDGVILRVVR